MQIAEYKPGFVSEALEERAKELCHPGEDWFGQRNLEQARSDLRQRYGLPNNFSTDTADQMHEIGDRIAMIERERAANG